MDFDTLTLSRLQFALTVMFHYLFPPLSIGLGWLMVFMEFTYLRTKNPIYSEMTRFWTRIFAVNFAVGVASGIVMEFQFGTNWSRYSRYVGDVFGSALAAEGIFAFFLESGFLAVLVFGWDRVSARMHFFSTCMVALGSSFSAVWIVIANSWQQTPAGHHIVLDATGQYRAEIVDFWAVVFNPSSMHRLGHVLLGSFILGSFFVMSICAWYLLRRRHEEFARKCFPFPLIFGTLSLVGIFISGDMQARKVATTQPAKLAAFEGHFHQEPGEGTPMTLVGIPNVKEQRMEMNIAVPNMLSWLVYMDGSKPVKALDEFPPEDRPPVLIPYITYHIMVYVWGGLMGLAGLAAYLWWKGKLFDKRLILWGFVLAVLGPYLANHSGWIAAEVGRQPWVVYGELRTSDAYSPAVPASHVGASIVMFSLIYFLLFLVWLFVLNSKIQAGPGPGEAFAEKTGVGDLLTAAARRGSPADYSLTSAKDQP